MQEKEEPQNSQAQKQNEGGWREAVIKDVFNEVKLELLHASEISLILKEYNDIFSDFDPRPYSQRTLSDDFLAEAKKASKVKKIGELELKFLAPEGKRVPAQEAMIKKRLHEYFRKHNALLHAEMHSIKMYGVKLTLLGFGMLILATYFKIIELKAPADFEMLYAFMLTILEPAGWFTAWTGLDHIIYKPREKNEDHEFYEKMSRAKISFTSY